MASSEERISAIKYVINGNMMDFTAFMKDWGTPIAAIAGACSWIPFFYSRFKKTKITIIPSSQCSVGFLFNGPVFRMSLGFAAKYNDVIISNIMIKFIHTGDSEEKMFVWSIIKQNLSSTIIPGPILPGATAEAKNERMSEVLAIKINQHFLEERFIVFYEDSILREIESKSAEAEKELSRLTALNEKESFLKTKQLKDICSTTEQSFCWKSGEYKLDITIETPTNENISIVNGKYIFYLQQEDIEQLEANKKLIRLYYESKEERNKIEWAWRYLKIRIDAS